MSEAERTAEAPPSLEEGRVPLTATPTPARAEVHTELATLGQKPPTAHGTSIKEPAELPGDPGLLTSPTGNGTVHAIGSRPPSAKAQEHGAVHKEGSLRKQSAHELRPPPPPPLLAAEASAPDERLGKAALQSTAGITPVSRDGSFKEGAVDEGRASMVRPPRTSIPLPPSSVDRQDPSHKEHEIPIHTHDGRAQALVNVWILLVMIGFIIIICVAKGRLVVAQPGVGWHSVTSTLPFAAPLEGEPTYVQAALMLPPWESLAVGTEGVLTEPTKQSAHRRLQELLRAPSKRSTLGSGAGEPDAPPTLDVFVGQQLGASLAWTPLTGISTCAYDASTSTECLFEFKDVTRLDDSLPAALVVAIDSGSAADVASAFIEVHQMGTFGKVKAWIALVVLALVLLALAFELMHRMWIAWIGAFAMTGLLLIANMVPDLETVYSWIDSGTMALLFGMMVIVGQLQHTGVFEVVCAACLKASRGRLMLLTIALCTMTAFVSSLLDNVTTMLLCAPMTIAVFKVLDMNPVPLLLAQAMLSNVGGTATMVGDPPNIIIGNVLRNYIGFVDFIIHLTPGVIIATPFCIAAMILMYRKDLTGRVQNMDQVTELVNQYKIKDWRLFWMCTYVTGAVVLAFLLQPIHHLNPGYVALFGATFLVAVAAPHDAQAVLHAVEWDMLLFFAGMFIMVEGAVELGLMRKIAALIALIIESSPPSSQEIAAVECILWFSAIFSALLDNIPYTIAMLPVITQLAADSPLLDLKVLTWALAFGACLGGNGTIIGASANIVTAGLAARSGYQISFFGWLRSGVPCTIVSVAIVNVYMLLRYCL